MDLTISIATYDRPELLAKTLQSCLAQQNRLGLSFEILVTDNHPDGAGLQVAQAVAAASAIPVRWQADLTRNMSTLRNAGIASARGAMIAFIDDDEVADLDWTDQLVGALRAADADVAVGLRTAIFAAGAPPAFDPDGESFVRRLDLPPGALVSLVREDGKPRFGLGTGNSLFKVATCFPTPQAFDESFGDAGGEDAELMVRLYTQGRRIVWCPQARVTETVPAHRTLAAYRLIRAKREAQHYCNIYLAHSPTPERVGLVLKLKGLIQVAVGVALAAATLEFGSERRLKGRLLMANGLGKLARRQVGYIKEPSLSA
ncbi:glycosyltransferase family 2 protein [Caulobacter sp. NIBR2454]|uniref:glycosyltransferase family 2 protein n=1 Tax=Caulobacter sp. NIBR2454 TaxID=3015996 RepID=UPI0022B6784C|nr:glycosyltransferase family 2 protein [Caulobacter sp. NIBR2454]